MQTFIGLQQFLKVFCFSPTGKLLIPQEELYKKNVLLVRGRFRPFTLLHNDMLMGAAQQFFCGPGETSIQEPSTSVTNHSAVFDECVYREDSTVLLELTTRSMMEVWRAFCCLGFCLLQQRHFLLVQTARCFCATKLNTRAID